MPSFSQFVSRRKVSIAIAASALLFIGVTANATESIGQAPITIGQAPITVESGGSIPLPGGTVIGSNINPSGHFICIDIKTKDLFYGQFNTNAICKLNSDNFGIVATTTPPELTTSINGLYLCVDGNNLRLSLPLNYTKLSNACKGITNIYVTEVDPVKFPNNHRFICADLKTGNFTDGGSGSIPVMQTKSNCFSIATTTNTKGSTTPTNIINTNIIINSDYSGVHFFCLDIDTNFLSYGGSGGAICRSTSKYLAVVNNLTAHTKSPKTEDLYFCVNPKTLDLYNPIYYEKVAGTCKGKDQVIYVTDISAEKIHHYMCVDIKTGNLYSGGSEKIAVRKNIQSKCFSIATTAKGTTNYTTLTTAKTSEAGSYAAGYKMCLEFGTNIIRHIMGNNGDCGPHSTYFYLGAKGPSGAAGAPGPTGVSGKDGKTIWNGTGDPENIWGQPGDIYINSKTFTLYGPKNLDGTWPAGVTLIGPKGDQGLTGPPGVGETGARGPAGATGSTGAASTVAGPAGAAGTNGTNGTNGAAGADGAGAINTVLSNFGQVVKINWLNSGCCYHGNQKLRIIFSFKNLTGSTIVFTTVGNMNLGLYVSYYNSAGTLLTDTGYPTLTWLNTPAELTVINGATAEFDVIVDNTTNFASPPAGAVSFSLAFRGQNLDVLGVWNGKLGNGMNGKYGPITSFTATPYWD